MADDQRVQELEARVATLEQVLGESLGLIERLARAKSTPLGVGSMDTSNLAFEAHELVQKAERAGIGVRR